MPSFAPGLPVSARINLIVLLALLLAGCGAGGYRFQDVAKSDTALIYELHYEQAQLLLRDLVVKLYKRNPSQLPDDKLVRERVHSLFEVPDFIEYKECGGAIETELMEAALQPDFSADRIFCLMAGLTGMINHSYSYKKRFFVVDSLDEQKLYRSARNIERLAWRLRQPGSNGQPLLLTNHMQSDSQNLSFERLFGKLIGQQDMLAKVASDQNKRAINYVVRSIGSIFFLPL